MAVTWDILIVSMVHRTAQFHELLVALKPQMAGHVGVRVLRHNLQIMPGDARQRLVEASNADYVSFIDDDDMVSSDYVAKIYAALQTRPDMVGFRGRFTYNCQPHPGFDISIKYGCHSNPPTGSTYDFMSWSPTKREHVLAAGWEGDGYRPGHLENADDQRYCNRLRGLNIVKTEAYIPEWMYWLRQHLWDAGYTPRTPLAHNDIPARPIYPFVTYLGTEDL